MFEQNQTIETCGKARTNQGMALHRAARERHRFNALLRRKLSYRLATPGLATREDTPPQKTSFERVVAMIATPAKPTHLAGCEQAFDPFALCIKNLPIQIGLETAQCLAGDDMQLDRDQWTVLSVKKAVRLGGAHQLVTAIIPSRMNSHQLRILGEGIVNLPVASHDLRPKLLNLDEITPFLVHSCNQILKRISDDEVFAMLFEGFNRRRRLLV